MKRIFFIAGLITAFVLPINNVFSAAITFTYTGHGSGNLDGISFFDVDFTIAATSDTANRQKAGQDIFSIDNTVASINISDVGNFTFTTPTRFFVNNTVNTVGFSHGGSLGLDLFNIQNAAFGSWNMLSSIGPVNGNGTLIQWGDFDPVVTSGGILTFNDDANVSATFEAVVSAVPEPEVYAMLISGLVLVGFAAHRTKKSSC